MSIFDRRVAFKPFEYPDAFKYIDAINHSYWVHTEVSFEADIQDFHVKLSDTEKNVIKNALLAISQIEVSVKTFWGKLYEYLPKPEFNAVGATFAESEVRHERAYSHLLEILNLNGDFEALIKVPAIQGRVEYLRKHLVATEGESRSYTKALTLFSLFVENVSLFSQFAIVKSFYKEKNILKDIDNIIQATQKEEMLHALFGIYVINQIKKEFPQWFDEVFYQQIETACLKAYEAEVKILEWIFEQGELDFIPINTLKEFLKVRFNESVEMIGGKAPFAEVDRDALSKLNWFIEELYVEVQYDFFHKRSNAYSKKTQSITSNDLF